MQHPELRQTTFGAVLCELMEVRGLEVTPFKVGKIAEESNTDGWRLINRMADANAEDPGDLCALVGALGLSASERDTLALAYAFEQRRGA